MKKKLLGTYQPLFRSGCDPALRDALRKLYGVNDDTFGDDWMDGRMDGAKDSLGFVPLCCFSCDSPREAFINSVTIAPNAPDLLFLFWSDDYVRVDKLKWYAMLRDSEDSSYPRISECLVSPDLDDMYCEFLVPVDTLPRYDLAVPLALDYELFFNARFSATAFLGGCRRIGMDYEAVARMDDDMPILLDRLSNDINRMRESLVADVSGKDSTIHVMWPFVNTFLSGFVKMVLDGSDSFDFLECFHTLPSITTQWRAYNEMAKWSLGSCDKAGYDAVLDSIDACWVDDANLAVNWCLGTLPGRNEPCPCGSGRKFKKCCGSRYGLV